MKHHDSNETETETEESSLLLRNADDELVSRAGQERRLFHGLFLSYAFHAGICFTWSFAVVFYSHTISDWGSRSF